MKPQRNHCPTCGTGLEGWERFCRSCGSELTMADLSTSEGASVSLEKRKPPFLVRQWGKRHHGPHPLRRVPWRAGLKVPLHPSSPRPAGARNEWFGQGRRLRVRLWS